MGNEFEELLEILYSEEWTEAIPKNNICPFFSEKEKELRARGIVDTFINMYVKNKRVLDFGCGEGHLVKELKKQDPEFIIGFDKIQQGKFDWENDLTINWNKVLKNEPYDLIIAYDVFDHINIKHYDKIVLSLFKIANKNCRLLIRYHPYFSSHGSHLYQELNKAWIHLIFNKEELDQIIRNDINYLAKDNYVSFYENIPYWNRKYTNIIKSEKDKSFLKNNLIKKRFNKPDDIDFVDLICFKETSWARSFH